MGNHQTEHYDLQAGFYATGSATDSTQWFMPDHKTNKIKILNRYYMIESTKRVLVTAKVAKMNLRIYEVGISYYGRTYDEGKKIGWRDGFRAIYCILKYNLWAKR